MPAKKDNNTEKKILEAARKVFMAKGYDGTRTRDIADEAGINLALLNYYFRSKQKLFQIVMKEKIKQLFGAVIPIINDETSSLETKIEQFVEAYLSLLQKHPDLATFVLNEIRNNPKQFSETMNVKQMIAGSSFIKQLVQKNPEVNPIHFLLNIISMTVFPFIGKPMLKAINAIQEENFYQFIEERKKLIPIWANAMLSA